MIIDRIISDFYNNIGVFSAFLCSCTTAGLLIRRKRDEVFYWRNI